MHVSYSEASCKLVHQFWHCFCLSSHDYITLLTFTCKIFPGIGRVLYKLTSKLNLIRSLPLSAHCPEVDQILFVRITCSYVHFFFSSSFVSSAEVYSGLLNLFNFTFFTLACEFSPFLVYNNTTPSEILLPGKTVFEKSNLFYGYDTCSTFLAT